MDGNVSELESENKTLQNQVESLETEVSTLRKLCSKMSEDIKTKRYVQRVQKKWSTLYQ